MKRSSFSLIISSIIFLNIYSQNFTVEDIEIGRLHELAPVTFENIQWRNGSNHILYSHNDTLYEVEPLKQKKKVVLTLNDLNYLLIQNNEEERKVFPIFESYDIDNLIFQVNDHFYSYSIAKKVLSLKFDIPSGFDNLAFNVKHSYAAYTVDSNVYLLDQYGYQTQVTYDSIEGITNGQIVYREEFGSDKGIFWSPKGNYIAFYHNDERGVSEYPLVRIDKRVAEVQNIRYPMAGMTSENTEVWIYSVSGKRIFKLAIESSPDDYHTNLSWAPDESSIYIQHLNRAQNKMVLKSYSIPEGKFVKEFFTEQDEQYVEPLHPLLFSKKNTSDFYYQSMRDGFNHLYKYEDSVDTLVQLTKGLWEVTDFIGADDKEENLLFLATKENPLEQHLYKYNFNGNTIIRLSDGKGTHTPIMNADGRYFIDIQSGLLTPDRITILDSNGNTKEVLLDAPNPVAGYKLGEVVIDKMLSADDSTEIYYRMVKPVDFDPARKYPVILYVYGGPHAQLITNCWMDRIDFLQQYFAQRGYLSLTIDPRGSDNRGAEFEQVIHRQSGIPQLEDHLRAIDYLRSLSYIDTSRIGIHGWSYGGYMTILMMLTHPEIFKVGVSGGPVIDWKYYEVMYGERYMDTPEENPDGYKLTNLRNYADSLKGDLLIIHGALDPTVVWQHSLSFLQSCIKSGVQPDYFVYPLHEHNVRGIDRVHLTRMITEYFFEHL